MSMRAGPAPRPPMRAAASAVTGAAAGAAAGWKLGRWHARSSWSNPNYHKLTAGERLIPASTMGQSGQLYSSALHEAAEYNDAEMIRRLLAAAADPHAMAAAKDEIDRTPLMHAAYLGNVQAVEALLEIAPEVAMVACNLEEGWWLPVHAGKLDMSANAGGTR